MVALISPTASSASLVTTTRLVSSTLRSIATTSSESVSDYMTMLQDEDEEQYKRQFS